MISAKKKVTIINKTEIYDAKKRYLVGAFEYRKKQIVLTTKDSRRNKYLRDIS